MRAVVCEALGDATVALGAGVLRLDPSAAEPALPKGHIKIQVVAASLNFPDALQIKGQYQDKRQPPFVPGNEVSGRVVAVAPGVTRVKVGDLVCAVCQGGAFAEQCVTHEASAWRLPEGVDVALAAAVPIVYGTAELALCHRAQIKAEQTVLILGAAGGVGVAAVQICKLLGAKVVAVASTPAKAEFLRQQGVDVAIDSSTATKEVPLHALIRKAAPKGVNCVFDPVGGKQFVDALKSVAWGAQYLVIGFASGEIPKVAANLLLVKNTTLHGIFWGSYLMNRPAVMQQGMERVLGWLAAGKLTVLASHRFPLEQISEAFKVLLSRQVMGKVLLDIQPAAKL